MQHGWQDSAHKKILDGAVGCVCSVPFAIALRALSVPWLAVFGLADTGERTVPNDLNWIERSSRHDLEFFSGRQRRNIAGIFYSEEVGEREEEPVFGCAGRV